MTLNVAARREVCTNGNLRRETVDGSKKPKVSQVPKPDLLPTADP